ncbi:heme-copper oxidase subunit III [Blastococcus sp. Marseille-P5729]|uniref:aa3-type cytochrome oxidase subunit III n=1 Tax=Blastococcus sp. Marseille-P5729 TaxID=2086582 RepID=UPI002100803C|nr:heme-copper oxidase subunit III [Blastococcus sp. Marseille-P5729]
MTTATTAYKSEKVHSLSRPNMVSVGVIVWLSSELMFFAGLFAMYFTAKAIHGQESWPPEDVHLNHWYALTFTLILVASSVTCQFGVFAAERGDVFGLRRWYTLTFLMGLIFTLGQAFEFVVLVQDGTTIGSSSYASVFYMTTGFHGLHVIGGLIAFVIILIRSTLGRFTPAQATSAIVVSYYWHFVDIVWIGLFTVIYIMTWGGH